MDSWLADVYGTGGAQDLEKTAQAQMIEKLAEEEGIDISSLNDEQLQAVAAEVLEEQPEEQPEETVDEELQVKEAQAKFEEADFLGRVMAHSYTQELEKIAGITDSAARLGREGVRGAKGLGAKLKSVATAQQLRSALKARKGAQKLEGVAHKTKNPAMLERARAGTSAANRSAARGAAKTVGLYGGIGAAGYGTKKALEKDASILEKLAEERAIEILQENGIDPNAAVETEQELTDEDVAAAVNERAVEMLKAAGYRFQG